MGAHSRLLDLYRSHLARLDVRASPRDGAALAAWRKGLDRFLGATDVYATPPDAARPALANLAAFAFVVAANAHLGNPALRPPYALLSVVLELLVRVGPRTARARLRTDDFAVADVLLACAARLRDLHAVARAFDDARGDHPFALPAT